MLKVAIMQPYFFPYLGYFQLMKSVDIIMIYDDIKFTKKGWIHRNRFLMNGKDKMFTLPLEKNSDYLDIRERSLANIYLKEAKKNLRRFESSYKKAPLFDTVFPVIKEAFLYDDRNLFKFIFNSLEIIRSYLDIKTKLLISSKLEMSEQFQKEQRVIAICKHLHATHYFNPIGGITLYNKQDFSREGIELFFIKMNHINYPQFNHNFVPNLSILDVLMFNSVSQIKGMLDEYTFV